MKIRRVEFSKDCQRWWGIFQGFDLCRVTEEEDKRIREFKGLILPKYEIPEGEELCSYFTEEGWKEFEKVFPLFLKIIPTDKYEPRFRIMEKDTRTIKEKPIYEDEYQLLFKICDI